MFKIADDDGSGWISGEELQCLIKEIYVNSYQSNTHVKKIVAEVSHDFYDLKLFKEFAKHHSALTMPLFDLQSALRKRVINMKFWMEQMKDRKGLDKKLVDDTLMAAVKVLLGESIDDFDFDEDINNNSQKGDNSSQKGGTSSNRKVSKNVHKGKSFNLGKLNHFVSTVVLSNYCRFIYYT